MHLPVLDPVFTRTPDADGREIFHSFTRGICSHCRELADTARILLGCDLLGRRSVRYDGESPLC